MSDETLFPGNAEEEQSTMQHHRSQLTINEEELSALVQKMEHPTAKLASRLLCTTGIRLRELISLKLQDVDLEKLVMKVMQKGWEQEIPVASFLRTEIADYIRGYRDGAAPGDSFLIMGHPPRGISIQWYHRRLKKAAVDAGITTDVTSHTLRRFFAVYVLSNVIRDIQPILGTRFPILFDQSIYRYELPDKDVAEFFRNAIASPDDTPSGEK